MCKEKGSLRKWCDFAMVVILISRLVQLSILQKCSNYRSLKSPDVGRFAYMPTKSVVCVCVILHCKYLVMGIYLASHVPELGKSRGIFHCLFSMNFYIWILTLGWPWNLWCSGKGVNIREKASNDHTESKVFLCFWSVSVESFSVICKHLFLFIMFPLSILCLREISLFIYLSFCPHKSCFWQVSYFFKEELCS